MPLVVKEIGKGVLSEVHFEWRILRFISLSKKVDDFYHSPVFSFDEAQWYLRLYPNGETDVLPERMSLYLMRKDSGCLKTVYFTLGIKGPDGVVAMEEVEYKFYKSDERYGFPDFWIRSELMKRKSYFMPSLELTITCDLRSYPHLNAITGEKKLGKSLLSMLESGEDSDVVLKVQGKEFPAHRCVLRARSSVFNFMFTHDMVEKQNGVVMIPDNFDPETFHDFLLHMYSGSSEYISTNNVFRLYMASDLFDISELKEECVKFMKRNLTVASFCNVIAVAVICDEKKLMDSATNFFCDNSLDIVKSSEWQSFLKKKATVGNELIIKMLSKHPFV